MKVKEIMKTKIISVKKGQTLKEAAEIFLDNQISGAPVVDEKGRLIGVLSEKDIFKAIYPNYEDFYLDTGLRVDLEKVDDHLAKAESTKVEEAMTNNVISVTPDTPVTKVGAMMMAQNIHRVIVIDNNKPAGIVTRRDIYKAIFKDELKI